MKKETKKVIKHKRPSWDEYFSSMVELVGTRSTCDRGKSGCVIVKDKRVLSTGYIGSPMGTAHAEQNAIVNAARFGIALDGATLYCHMTPCYVCAKMIINGGIKRVICNLDYHAGGRSKKLFKEAKVKYELLSKKIQTYKDM